MTKMEIASHLALVQIALSQGERGSKAMEDCLEAVREAQMIMFTLALAEIADQVKEGSGEEK